MLQHLYIRNYILIDELSVDFRAGFSVVTGETGAGKSIFLGALAILAGERISGKLLKDDSKKAIFEAAFLLDDATLQPLFNRLDVDFDKQTFIRRELLPSGKSRAFINDTPVSLAALKQIAVHLVDIHSQHENLLLGNSEFQFSIVDAAAGSISLLEEYRRALNHWNTLRKQLEALETKAEQARVERDFLQYRFDQLEQAALQPGEYERLEAEIDALSHYEDIKYALTQTATLLNEQDDDLPTQINRLAETLQAVEGFFEKAGDWKERLLQTAVELQDIADEVLRENDRLEYNPGELEAYRERLDMLNRLMQKNNVASFEELLAEKERLETQLLAIDSFDEEIARLKADIHQAEKHLEQQAVLLTAKRQKVLPELSAQIQQLIRQLGMPNAQFEVRLSANTEYSAFGRDALQFLFSSTAAKKPEPVNKVASGGELSRIMLAVKSILAQKKQLPTLIFDEIDTGISGEIAARMASIMKAMSQHMQIIAITHLPQITAKGAYHYLVEKKETSQAVHTTVRLLQPEERVREVAKMLSNGDITETMLQNAKELLEGSAVVK